MDDGFDIDVVMPIDNLIEYSDIYSKISGSLWQCYRDESALNDDNVIIITLLLMITLLLLLLIT